MTPPQLPLTKLGKQPDGTYSERYRAKLNEVMKDKGVTWKDNTKNPGKIDDFELVGGADKRVVVQQAIRTLDSRFKDPLAETRKTIRVDRKRADTTALQTWEKWALAKVRTDIFPAVEEIGSLYYAEENLEYGQWLKEHAEFYPNALWWWNLTMQDASPVKSNEFGATYPFYPDLWPKGHFATSYLPKDFTKDELQKLIKQSSGLDSDPHMDNNTVVRRAKKVSDKNGWRCSEDYCSIPFNQYHLYKARTKTIATAFRAISRGDPGNGIILPETAKKMYSEAADCWENGDFRRLSQVFATYNQKLQEEGYRLVVFAQPVEGYDLTGTKFMTYGFAGIRTERSERLMSVTATLMSSIPELERRIEAASKGAYKAKKEIPKMNNIFVEYADAAGLLRTYPPGLPIGVNTDNYPTRDGERRAKLNLSMIDAGDRKHEIYVDPIVRAVFPKEYQQYIDADHMQYLVMAHEAVTNLGAGVGFITPNGTKANEALAEYWSDLDEATSDSGYLQLFYEAFKKEEVGEIELKKAVTTWIANKLRQITTMGRNESHSRGSQFTFGDLLLAENAVVLDGKGNIKSIDFLEVCKANEKIFDRLQYIRTNGDKGRAKALAESTVKKFDAEWAPLERVLAKLRFPSQFRQEYD